MNFRPRLTKNTVLFGGTAVWGLLLISCVAVNRTMLAPPFVAGAAFVGNKGCVECHEEQTSKIHTSLHAKVSVADASLGSTSCESCHGAGSLHVKAGGTKGNIINPRKTSETCFQCHLDKRGEFSLANSHQVMNGKMSCGDCHDPHEGHAIRGSGASLEAQNENCTSCHTAQKGPFVFAHNAMREGCVACHNPHGSVNQKMLVARDANLCLRCHLQTTDRNGAIFVGGEDHRTRLQNGTCWIAGCHEAVHGSNASKPLRY
ncbi:cytochrome c3 family protein [Horticoccus sp. 23ND18S-11]|uniref:cytochrome c3 family protein n=1 Tax=Horticoccus sp. 23ND18S-11 TaxID=3391832 RepID=UPI0039C96827